MTVTQLSVWKKEAGNGPGTGTESSLRGKGGEGGDNKQTVCTRVAQQRRADSECHAPAEAGKAYSGMAGPTGMQQARDSMLGNASSLLLEEEGRLEHSRDGDTNGLGEGPSSKLAGRARVNAPKTPYGRKCTSKTPDRQPEGAGLPAAPGPPYGRPLTEPSRLPAGAIALRTQARALGLGVQEDEGDHTKLALGLGASWQAAAMPQPKHGRLEALAPPGCRRKPPRGPTRKLKAKGGRASRGREEAGAASPGSGRGRRTPGLRRPQPHGGCHHPPQPGSAGVSGFPLMNGGREGRSRAPSHAAAEPPLARKPPEGRPLRRAGGVGVGRSWGSH